MFPEEFETFLLTDPKTRACFLSMHADLLDAGVIFGTGFAPDRPAAMLHDIPR